MPITPGNTIVVQMANTLKVYPLKSDMLADGVPALNSMAAVISDPVESNNVLYRKTAAPPTATWTSVLTFLPGFQFIVAQAQVSGTGNAIEATSTIPIPRTVGAVLIAVQLIAANTSTSVTLKLNSDVTLYNVKTNTGGNPSVGALTAGAIVFGIISAANTFTLFNEGEVAAAVAAAQAAAATAVAAQVTASAAAVTASAAQVTASAAAVTATNASNAAVTAQLLAQAAAATAAADALTSTAAASAAAASAASIPEVSQGPDKIGVTGSDGYYQWYIDADSIEHPQFAVTNANAEKAANVVAPQGPDKHGMIGSDGWLNFEMTPTRINHPAFNRVQHFPVDALASPSLSDIATLAEYVHLIAIGQSNPNGFAATPAISTTASTNALMFNGGVRPDQGNTVNSNILAGARASLTALVESNATTSFAGFANGGETCLTATVDMIVQLLAQEDGLDFSSFNQKFLCSVDANGGSGIAGMRAGIPGPPYVYNRYSASMTAGRDLANAADKSYVPGVMIFIQGETDNANNVTYSYYLTELQGVQSDFQGVSDGLMGSNRRAPMAILQTTTHLVPPSPTRPNVALAQLAACSDEKFLFVGPGYVMPMATVGIGQLHYSNVGQKWIGGFMGLAIKRLLFDQVKIAPLVPTFTCQPNGADTKIIARFPVDYGKRIEGGVIPGIPNTALTVQSNWGVTATAADGVTAKALTNPKVVGRDCVVWDAPETPADAWLFRCAWTGSNPQAWCNIRESDPIIFDPMGLRLPVQRWVPICEVSLTL
jgi:hypothetical protein